MKRLYEILRENKKKYVYLPLGIYWLILFILTSLPSTSFADALRFSDKIKHFIAYLILSFLLSLALHFQEKWDKLKLKYAAFAVIISSVYGMLDEVHQIFIPNRSAELLDWLADFSGSLLGAIIVFYIIKQINTELTNKKVVEK